jgi:predicted enzyme related to lactoylglutathione lyase
VKDLAATLAALAARGFQAADPPFEIPDGSCQRFHDPSGNALAILQRDHPDALVAAYQDPGNPHSQR